MKKEYVSRYPLAIQLTVPNSNNINLFMDKLEIIKDYGFEGVELNIPDIDNISAKTIKNILDTYDLRMFNMASGGIAVKEGLSLSSPDRTIRDKTILRLKDMIRYSEQFECGIILGYIKGGANQNKDESEKYMIETLKKVTEYAEEKNVPLIIEATNHYETSIAITLKSAVKIVQALESEIYKILPDTYHMNIEELNMCASLYKYIKYFNGVHISDNNRFFPGLGGVNFKDIYLTLINSGFSGYLGIEGNILNDLESDIDISINLIKNIEKSIRALEHK